MSRSLHSLGGWKQVLLAMATSSSGEGANLACNPEMMILPQTDFETAGAHAPPFYPYNGVLVACHVDKTASCVEFSDPRTIRRGITLWHRICQAMEAQILRSRCRGCTMFFPHNLRLHENTVAQVARYDSLHIGKELVADQAKGFGNLYNDSAQDMLALLKALGKPCYALVGHDWGALHVWCLGLQGCFESEQHELPCPYRSGSWASFTRKLFPGFLANPSHGCQLIESQEFQVLTLRKALCHERASNLFVFSTTSPRLACFSVPRQLQLHSLSQRVQLLRGILARR